MKKEFLVDLHSINDLKDFIEELNLKTVSDVDATYDRQTVDARSFLGVMSLAFHPITVKINSDNDCEIEDFNEICKKYEVKE